MEAVEATEAAQDSIYLDSEAVEAIEAVVVAYVDSEVLEATEAPSVAYVDSEAVEAIEAVQGPKYSDSEAVEAIEVVVVANAKFGDLVFVEATEEAVNYRAFATETVVPCALDLVAPF